MIQEAIDLQNDSAGANFICILLSKRLQRLSKYKRAEALRLEEEGMRWRACLDHLEKVKSMHACYGLQNAATDPAMHHVVDIVIARSTI